MPRYHVFFETAGLPAYELYINSPEYTDNNCEFISVAPQGNDLPSWITVLKVLMKGYVQPTWLGGVPRKYR